MKKTIAFIGVCALMAGALSANVFAAGFTPSATQNGPSVSNITTDSSHFTPSVSQKGSPSVSLVVGETGKPILTANGEQAVAAFKDANGNVVGLPEDALSIVSVLNLKDADPVVKKNMENAINQVSATKNISELSPDFTKVFADAKTDLLKSIGSNHASSSYLKNLKVEDLIVRDIFDVSLDKTATNELDKDNTSVTISFKLDLAEDSLLMVLHNYEDAKWEVIPNEFVERQDNGDVFVTFNDLSPIAFVVNCPQD